MTDPDMLDDIKFLSKTKKKVEKKREIVFPNAAPSPHTSVER